MPPDPRVRCGASCVVEPYCISQKVRMCQPAIPTECNKGVTRRAKVAARGATPTQRCTAATGTAHGVTGGRRARARTSLAVSAS